MKRTRICDLLGIQYPIIQGGMTWIANAELAAAVSNAGALGLVSPNAGMKLEGNVVEHLKGQIRKAKSLTDKPFGVNLAVRIPEMKELIDVIIEEGIKVVTTSAGDPALYTPFLKERGGKVLHVVSSVSHAKGAERSGVDAVIAEGYEAGGHNGFDELPTMVLVPQVVDAVDIPVVAAGGIADARGFAAALALGAEGVQMGTRFVATHECVAHPNFKEGIVKATDTGTVITGRKLGPARVLKGEFTSKLLELEARGATPEEFLV
ncbi:MAG: enoyl-[acyl-carrier-protein] reductase FabK, partial [Dehalococcoidia bacterium]